MKLKPAKATQPNHRVESRPGAPVNFPIVGVGASAGGLEAFRQLLQNLPPDTGMAFVLVQHLDPDHPSALTQLLARCAAMPVREVEDGLQVAPNQVYIIPPNTSMIISRGILKLQPRPTGAVGLRPINVFLESLAQDQGQRSIGVVLSGTASDGTLGLEAIKAEGGITFAQDDSAKYNSMPRSAIAAGCVDLVMSPENIASELARIARHPYVAQPSNAVASGTPSADENESKAQARHSGNSLQKVLVLLRRHSGVDFSSYKFNTIHRRLNRRVVLNKLGTVDEYARFLRNHPKELDALFSDVLISVTSFFRNPEAFAVLKSKVFPALLRPRRQEPVRVWVAGCSTGQEAYSIAMSYHEFSDTIASAPKIQIFATDLHDQMLGSARTGLYARNMVEDLSPERLRRFFTEEDGGWRVNKSLRESVVFARQNALSDPPFSRMDLISCRNVLIYFDSSLQKKVLPAFHYALKPAGFLFLGAAESVGGFGELFEAVDKKHRLFVKKPALKAPFSLPLDPQPRRGKAPRAALKTALLNLSHSNEMSIQREADRMALFRYAAPSVLVNLEGQILQFRGDTSPYLKPPSGKATFNLLKMAREGLLSPLRTGLNKARKENRAVRREHVKILQGSHKLLNLEIIPLKNLKDRHFLIFFEPIEWEVPVGAKSKKGEPSDSDKGDGKTTRLRMAEVERELSEARDYLQSVQEQYEAGNEELQASNEEIISANEELQSVNEELETAKEELEASNEELTTVNEEMAGRNTELAQLNSDLVNFQNSANAAVLLLGRNLAIRRFTPPAAKQFNLLPTDVGRPISGLRHNLEISDLEAVIHQVMATGKETQREVRDQRGQWHLLRVVPYLGLEKEIEGAVLVLVDINDLKQYALEMAEQREYAEAIIRSAPVAFIVLEPDLRVQSANDAFYDTFKVLLAQTEGHSIFELGDGQWNIPKLRQMLTEVIPRNSFFDDFEVIHLFEHIGRRTMLLNARILQSSGAQPKRILLGILDITRRIQAEEAQKVLAAIVECSADAIISKDLNGNILSWNQGAERLFGYAPGEIIGRNIYELIPAANHSDENRILERVMQGGRIYHYETARLRKDGSVVEVSLSASPVRDASDKIIGASTIARDISDRKKADAALREAKDRLASQANALETLVAVRTAELTEINKHLEAFVYSIAHDLRAPLRALQSFSALLLQEAGPILDDQRREYASRISKSAQFMDALLKDLLAFSRLSQQRLILAPVALEVVVQTALARLEMEIQEKKALVEWTGTWPKVLAHEATLTQVVINLIGNAIKFVEPQVAPLVRLRAVEEGEWVKVWVEDNGIGIAPEHHDQIFHLFTRLGGETYPGTGLGLAIVQKGIEHMGGRTGVESTLGVGSRFWFELRKG